MNKWITKYAHNVCYIVVKIKLLHATAWIIVGDIMLNEKAKKCRRLYIQYDSFYKVENEARV